MRIPRLAFCLLALAVGNIVGCSQTSWLRSNAPSKMKTVASVGDKPLPIVAGEPGSSTTAETEQLDLSPSTGGQISGRVFDDRGNPVPKARVRLVVGGAAGGRDNYATTDRSGAFTLRGLRPGRTYTLIAESQSEEGMMSGRAEARVSQTDVRIDVASRSSGSESRPMSIRPVRSRIDPTSAPDEGDDQEFPPLIRPGGALPGEDEEREEPAEEAASLSSRTSRQSAARLATATSTPIRAGWSPNSRSGSAGVRKTARPRNDAIDAGSRYDRPGSEAIDREYDDDGENPLPPALAPGESVPSQSSNRAEVDPRDMSRDDTSITRSRIRGRPNTPVALTPENGDSGGFDPAVRRDAEEPRPIPDDVLQVGRGVAPASYGPSDPMGSDDGSEPPSRASQSPRGRRGVTPTAPTTSRSRKPYESTAPVESEESSDGDRSDPSPQLQRRPTWRELSISPNAIPLDESVRRTSVVDQTRDRDVVRLAGNSADTGGSREADPVRRRIPSVHQPATESAATGESTCEMDAAERRIVDFQLPDLDGRMVSFRDIDADVILIDFWGSWCLQCRKSIAYERALQARLGGKRVQVIGIACEKGATLEERRASAAKAVRSLGINYPVLVSSMDGNCPLQKAFQVQFYPTLVVVDRDGRILHVEQGATDATLGRTDRTIVSALHDADSRVE
jgi:thiol-disulfide isomerase/thioredoxin